MSNNIRVNKWLSSCLKQVDIIAPALRDDIPTTKVEFIVKDWINMKIEQNPNLLQRLKNLKDGLYGILPHKNQQM